LNLKKHEDRFHTFFSDHHQREEKNAGQRPAFGRPRGDPTKPALHVAFHMRARFPHVNDQRANQNDSDNAEYALP
jgi:hypothetical protein